MPTHVGGYPGSFNPLTIAHLAIAEAAQVQCGLDRVELVLSRATLGKADDGLARIEERSQVIEAASGTRPWLAPAISDAQLIGDIAGGYDVIIVGADKWAQIIDPAWYGGDSQRRDEVVAALPRVAFAPRAGHESERPPLLPSSATILDVHEGHHAVSATAARDGRAEWMAPEALDVDRTTGAWSDPARYAAWRAAH